MTMTYRLLPLAAALLLAACATPTPPPTPDPKLPSAWLAPQVDAQPLPWTWWTRLEDPLLPPLVERAFAQSPSLAQARARLSQAQAQRQAAQAALGPQLQGDVSAHRGQQAPPLHPSSSGSWSLQAGWEIDLFGSARAARAAAGHREVAAELTLENARLTLAAEVAQALLAWRLAQAQLQLAQADQQLAERNAAADAQLAAAGVISPAGAALSHTLAAQARSSTEAWIEQRAVWLQTLALLCADDAVSLQQQLAGAPASLPKTTALKVDVLPATLLERRPDLQAALRRWQAAALDAQGAAISGKTPQLSFSALVGRGHWEMSTGTFSGSIWNLAPSLSIPIFDGGGRAAATAQARAQEQEARAALEGQWRGAVSEVEQGLLRWHAATAQRREAELSSSQWQRIADASGAQARSGLISGQALIREQRNALAAQSNLLNATREQVAAWLQLVRALGGGWTASNV